jgi:hypothetical protein
LGFVEVSHAFRASLVGDDVNAISDALAVTDVVALGLGIASGFEDCFIGTLGEAGPAGNTLIRYE